MKKIIYLIALLLNFASAQAQNITLAFSQGRESTDNGIFNSTPDFELIFRPSNMLFPFTEDKAGDLLPSGARLSGGLNLAFSLTSDLYDVTLTKSTTGRENDSTYKFSRGNGLGVTILLPSLKYVSAKGLMFGLDLALIGVNYNKFTPENKNFIVLRIVEFSVHAGYKKWALYIKPLVMAMPFITDEATGGSYFSARSSRLGLTYSFR